MENKLQVFNNEMFGQVRTVLIDNEVWFVGKDIVEDLGYDSGTSYTRFVEKYRDEDDYIKVTKNTPSLFINYQELGRKGGYLINEYGVIKLCKLSPIFSEDTTKNFLKFLNISDKEIIYCRKEIEFLNILETQLKMFGFLKFERQYSKLKCGNYRIDLFLPEINIAIEYDETKHKYYTYEQQELRQKLIEEELKCSFIRVSDNKSHIENSAIVLRELMKLNKLN